MKLLNQYLVLAVVGLHCQTVESLRDHPYYGQKFWDNGDNLPGYNHSMLDLSDIYDFLTLIEEEPSSIQLQLLYDPQHEEVADGLSEIISEDFGGLTVFQNDKKETTLTEMMRSTSGLTTLLLALLSSASVIDTFQMIRRQRIESHFVHWILLLAEEDSETQVLLELQELVTEGTRVTAVAKTRGGDLSIKSASVNTENVMRFYNKGTLNSKVTEKRRKHHIITASQEQDMYSNMNGRELVVAANDMWPFFGMGGVSADGTVKPHEGIDVMILRSLSAVLNFTYRVVRPLDRGWGNPQPDGTVTGFIGMVARRETNFAITIIAITSQRETVVDFTFPYYLEPLTIFSRAPKQKNRALAVFSPFTYLVWLCIIISTLAIGPTLQLLSIISQKQHQGRRGSSLSMSGLQQFSFNAFRNLVVQGNLIKSHRWHQRFLFFFWYLFCLIISALYSGMLTAVLAIPVYETPIDSLEDLPRAVRKDGFTIGVLKDSSNENLFKDAKEGIYKQTWELFNHVEKSESFITQNSKAIRWILERKFAYIGPRSMNEIIASRLGIRKFHVGRRSFFPQNVGIACPPGVPYLQTFSSVLLRMTEGGLISKWKKDEIRKIPQSILGEGESGFSAFTISQLQASFLMVLIGYVVAATTLLAEIVHSRVSLFKNI